MQTVYFRITGPPRRTIGCPQQLVSSRGIRLFLAANLKDFSSDVLLAGIKTPIEQMQLMRFNGETSELFGEIISGEVGH